MALPAALAEALAEFCDGVRSRFGARVSELTLFGSQARGDAHEDSDVDVLVTIDDLTSDEARGVDAIVGDVLTRHDVLITPLLMSSQRWRQLRARERAIVAEIDREGVRL